MKYQQMKDLVARIENAKEGIDNIDNFVEELRRWSFGHELRIALQVDRVIAQVVINDLTRDGLKQLLLDQKAWLQEAVAKMENEEVENDKAGS